MNNKKMLPAVTTGIAAVTLAAGAAYVMNAKSMKGQRKAIKKTAGKAARAVSEVVGTMVDHVASGLLG